MFRFLRHWFSTRSPRQHRSWRQYPLTWFLCLTCLGIGIGVMPALVPLIVKAQGQNSPLAKVIQPTVALPSSQTLLAQATPTPAPTPDAPPASAAATPAKGKTESKPTATSTYVWAFNRSREVGSRLRLQGVYPEARLGFTRPREWEMRSAQVTLRYQHSPSLAPDRSNLTVRINDTSIGSIPIGSQAQVEEAKFNIPASLLQEENEISILAEQHTSADCSDPSDPTLWTEIQPDSNIVFNYQPQRFILDFSRYPYPFLDELSLDDNQLTYVRPKTYSADWLTAVSRFHTSASRLAGYRPLDTKILPGLDQASATPFDPRQRLIVIGTPAEQAALAKLALPFPLKNGQFLDGQNAPLPSNVGLLMMTTLTKDSNVPVLVATGNSPEGVLKAVQFLVQDRQLGTGQALIVNDVTDVPSPSAREWPAFLPTDNTFNLSALSFENGKPFEEVTVRGVDAPPVHIAFHALPDDRMMPGNTMTLNYSYSPQVDPRTSSVEVRLDDITVASKRLNSRGGDRETFTLELPNDQIKPNTVLDIHFIMRPQEAGKCGLQADQQLWATVHADTNFQLKRDNIVQVPDLTLLQSGYPLTAPQDLSTTAIALPQAPNDTDVVTLLTFSERLGRISRADTVKTEVFLGNVPETVKQQKNIVGIGVRDRFPVPEVFEAPKGFDLGSAFSRQWEDSRVQTLSDNQGVVKAVLSPWNGDRQLVALTAQTEKGLAEIQTLLDFDNLFYQLKGDTLLINRNKVNPNPLVPGDYNLQSFEETQHRTIAKTSFLGRIVLFLQDHWYMVPVGIAIVALPLYGFSQLYLNRVDDEDAQ